MIVSLIVAMTEYGVIGHNNVMPWNIPDEMAYFKMKTIGHPVIMGRKTFESIGRPLPQRINLVITKNPKYKKIGSQPEAGLIVVNSLAEAIDWCNGECNECFIIGGANVYKQALDDDLVDRMYINFIKHPYEGNVLFPELIQDMWNIEYPKQEYDEFLPTIWARKKIPYGEF